MAHLTARRTVVGAVAAAALALGAAPAHAHGIGPQTGTFSYVDCSRTHDGNGSAAHPWTSLADVNKPAFSPGDHILFARGTTCIGTLAPQGSGIAGSDIVVDAYGTADRPLPRIDGNGATETVSLRNQQYFEIHHLDVTNAANPGTNRRGIHVDAQDAGKLSHIVISGVTVHDVLGDDTKDADGSDGIVVSVHGTSVPTWFDDVRITDNTLTRVNREGIVTASSWAQYEGLQEHPFTHVLIQGNTLSRTGGDGIVVEQTSGGLVDHNTLAGFNVTSHGYNAGIWPWDSDHVTFQYNEVSGGHGHQDSMAYDIDDFTDTIVYQYNYSHDNDGGFALICGTTDGYVRNSVIRYNISQNDSYRGIENCSGPSGPVQVYNNTIYVKPGAAMAVLRENNDSTARNVQFTNNVVVNAGAPSDATFALSPATSYQLTNNTFYNTTTAPGTGTLTTNPLLVAGGTGPRGERLCTKSPALADGLPIANNGGQDYFGSPIPPGAPNRGAYAGPGVRGC
ncbi:hypothetical protein ABIA35_009613 [Catenulispora sp. MAP12-49]|uniref:right-handed parallel beta-helix repeat-containing protein n=1 Tax=unclassified Catenulispora TaxID=414885 RepID=UPI0035160795